MATLFVDKLDPQSGTSLEIGSSGDTITIPSGATITNSGTATGFGGGKILQIVTANLSSEGNTTSTSYASTSLAASITPSATSSKVLILMAGPVYQNTSSEDYIGTIYRGVSDIGGNGLGRLRSNGGGIGGNFAITYLDSPSTTSSTTYTYYHKVTSGTGYISINNLTSTITLLEVGA
jgi:hypothetical protein